MEEKRQKKLPAIFVLLVAIVGAGMLWFFHKEDFVINDVPFITLYNHTGKNAYIVNDMSASLITVLEYYGADFSDADYQKINSAFFDSKNISKSAGTKLQDFNDIQDYAEQLGYDGKIEMFGSLKDLKKYINPTSKTPVIVEHGFAIGQNPLIKAAPFGVLIGVLEKENAVVLHDYYWGYNKKIGWEDFKKIASRYYLVLQPKNSGTLGNKKIPYPERTASMDKAATLIDQLSMARGAYGQLHYDIAFKIFQEVLGHKDFEEHIPPYYKLITYVGVAEGYRRVEKNHNQALKFALKANDLNHDLDQPFGDYWPGFEDRTNAIIDKTPGPPQTLGHVYQAQGKLLLAKKKYEESISIWPDGEYSQTDLRNVNKILNKK